MRFRFAVVCAASLCLLMFTPVATAALANSRCSLPTGLGEELARKYPAAKVVDLGDLSRDDRGFFQKDHGDRCPGLARVDFYGDGKPTWALVLIASDGRKREARLVVARQVGANWETSSLDTANGSAPVVWRQDPGEYRDVYGEKTIRATHPVIVFAGYESWAILYAWTGKRVQKIWLAD